MSPILKSHMLLSLFFVIMTLSLCFQSSASSPIEVHPVHFEKGTSEATLKGEIVGSQIVDYKLGAKAGQTMQVSLQSDNLSNYFNVLPLGSETALFVGSVSGNQWTGELPSDGDYTVRVYLMRNAARRGERANYTLKVAIHSAVAKTAPTEDAMVAGTPYHATGNVPCSMGTGQPTGSCPFGVTREGNGSGTVAVTKPDGRTRAIFFKNGQAIGYDASQAETARFGVERQGDLNIIHIGPERYEIPDAIILGG